jgi:biopolymer transport protein ExbD
MRFRAESPLLTTFSVSSMTDVVMLLLIFFLLSSSFVMHSGIKVQLPNAETGDIQAEKNIVVSLTDRGQLYVNSQQVTLEQLGRALARTLQAEPATMVVVQADRNVTLQNTVQVIDIAKAVGATRFMIATQPSVAP